VQIGISAPQGCGKTTVVAELEQLFAEASLKCAVLSVDDFYLSHEALRKMSADNPDNRLVQGRGNAGTHNLELGNKTLSQLRALGCAAGPKPAMLAVVGDVFAWLPATSAAIMSVNTRAECEGVLKFCVKQAHQPLAACSKGEETALPRYDKSAFGGEGDTDAGIQNWPVVTGPLDIILFEGWMRGFSSIGQEEATKIEQPMGMVDERLRAYKGQWDAHVHAWLVIKVGNPEWVFKWRLEAEQKMKAAGKDGMSDDGVRAFVNRYLPAYRAYLLALYKSGPATSRQGHLLYVEVDETRALVAADAR
jgi:D-glycerate 3-kinase